MTNSINELLQTQVIFVIGSNTTEAHPVTGYRIKQAAKDTTKLIVADPRKIELVRYADLWLRHRPGTDIALLNGLAHIIVRDDLWDKEFVCQRCEGFEEWRSQLQKYTPDHVAKITGVKAELLEQAAHMFGEAQRAAIVYAMGITQHATGTNNVFAVANLAILTGNVGREGTGVYPLRGQNNVQGACDMGCLPNYFPAYQHVTDEGVRQRFEKVWGGPLPAEEGLTVTEMINAAVDGQLKAMYVFGENPVLSDPDSHHVRKGLEALDFLVVQDIFMTETAQLADVVLPGTSFAEKDGTFTNTERRIQRVRKAIEPQGGALPDWQIIIALANELGHPWYYPGGPEQVMEEIAQVTPIYGGITYPRLEETGIQWPCPTLDHPGTKFLHAEKFSRGKGRIHTVEYIPPAEEPDEEYPFLLSTGRMLYQFHTGSMSRRSKGLEAIHSEELAMLHPQDATKLGIEDNELVEVESRRGKIQTKVQVTDHVPPGMVWMTFHFNESPANVLTIATTDPICKIPELKVCAVRVSKLP